MNHTSYIELSRSAAQNNFDYLRKIVGSKCTISHVVKGNAYGHGIEIFVPMAMDMGASHFATSDAFEALEVLNSSHGTAGIMIMGMIENDQLEWAVENDIEFYVFDMDRLRFAATVAKKIGKKARVHIEFETGMNRTGFEEDLLPEVQDFIKKNSESLYVKGFCTHYAGAEHYSNFLRIKKQYNIFNRSVKQMREAGIEAEKIHSASSAATVRMPKTRMDLVRVGILQYGYWPSTETYIQTIKPAEIIGHDPLRRIISWKSSIMSVKHVKQGSYIGYGSSYLATNDMKIATVPVGYSHGFSRSLSNQGRALLRGNRVPVIGTVNMNMMMLDISSLDNVEKGDEVVLIGKQGDLSISVSSFSEYSDQLNYELLTRLPHDIPRHVVK